MVRISFRLFYIIPVVVLILVPGLAVLLDPFPPLAFGPWRWTGVALFLSGAALFVIAHRFIYNPSQWAEKPTPFDEPNQLVTRGPYRWIRNPIADGGFLMLAGEGIFLRSLMPFIWLLFLMVVGLPIIILVEERRLEKRFGESYRRYKAATARFIPGVF